MSQVSQRERLTQAQMLKFFQVHLGYRYLGDWKYREYNSHVETDRLRDWLTGRIRSVDPKQAV